ncbi:MAG: hypothetical protein G3I08_09875 [Ferrovum sp.]|nr:hypothetical protein [Ferrovum sp.]
MPIALTIFGVAIDGLDPTLCYVLLRTVRGPGGYPAPTLPEDVAIDNFQSTTVPDSTLTVITWDKVLSEAEEPALLCETDQGRLTIPVECPIGGGETITGLPFGPLIVEEKFQKSRISGVGLLYRKGIASNAPFKVLREVLDKNLKPGTAPKALRALVAKIGELSGIDEIFKRRRPIGIVDYFYRGSGRAGLDGPLFDVAPEKLDLRTNAPMLQVHVRRHAAPLDQKFKVHVTLGNYDDVLRSVLLKIEAGVPEIVVSAPTHITDVSLSVFNNEGTLIDQLNGKFIQSMQFGLSALGAVDMLPPPFPGSPKSPDLEARPRVHTITFEGPSIAKRSSGLDVLRKQEADVSALIGPLSTEFEYIWFERGVEGQLEVIRWIKKKIEQPGITKAYLFDPYLGSEALKRVVARQGNETAELFIVVSPGDIDPDANMTEASAASDYLAKLACTATEWADKLVGRISVVHIKRGDGSRQAFHDRYLCVVNQKGVPTAYLLSNSLSKAAGDWPFAICELDRVMSWRVYAYILELVQGQSKDCNLQPEVIWKSPDTFMATEPDVNADSLPSNSQPSRVVPVNAFLSDIWDIIIRNSDFKSQVGARVDAFLRAWPQGIDMDKLAGALFKVVSHRDAIVVFISDRLRDGGRAELANFLDENLLARFLELLPGFGHKGELFIPFDARRAVLENLGRTITRKYNATNFLRARLNPKIHELVTMIETQRHPALPWDEHEAGVFLSIMALQVASDSEGVPERFRIGVATDYIHWLGRLMRSDVAASEYVARDRVPPEWLDDLVFAAQQIAKARRILGEALDVPIGRVTDDPWVAPIFKDAIIASLVDGGAVMGSHQ